MPNNNLEQFPFEVEIISDSPILAVARARVSEGSEDEIKNSLQSQKDDVRKLAQRLNVGEIYWFIELEAVSAFKRGGDTELFKQARAFACSNKDVKYFLQWDQTRFCRDRLSSQLFKRELAKHNVDVRFCVGDVENRNSGSGVMHDGFQELVAEIDGIHKGQHVLRGCLTNAKNRDEATGWCFKNGGSSPYGYKRFRVDCGKKRNGDPLLKTVWVENDEVITCTIADSSVTRTIASWTRYILIELRLKEGMGFDRIRDHLNKIGLPAPRGKFWADTTICEMTRNVAYIGRSIYNKHNYSSYRRGMGIKIKDSTELIIEDNSHPALITEEQFTMLQNMTKPANSSIRGSKRHLHDSPYLLANFFCKSCNGTVIGNNHRYGCGVYHRKGKEACGASAYSMDQVWLEEEVIKRVGLTFDEKIVQGIIENRLKRFHIDITPSDISGIREKIEKDKKARQSLLDVLKTNPPQGKSLEFIMSNIEELSKSVESCELELQSIIKPVVVPTKKEIEEEIEDYAKLFKDANYEQKRAILKLFIKKIILDPFNKCTVLCRYSDVPQYTMLVNNKKPPFILGASTIKVHCGGWI